MQEFDYRTISDEGIRTEYKHAIERALRIGESLQRAYGADQLPIAFKYARGDVFNAKASKADGGYLVQINNSVPLFNIILFSRLLSDNSVFPLIDTSGTLESDYELPAVIDPLDFDQRADWNIKLNAARSFTAMTLADICTTFVICHEVGHIVSGHVEGSKAFPSGERRG